MPRPIAFVLILVVLGAAVGAFVLASLQSGGDRPVGTPEGPGGQLGPAQDRPLAALSDSRTDTGIPGRVADVLAAIREDDRGQLAVSEEDGRLLRVLASTSRTRRALEIGAASGYSAIWIGLALRETGGRLVTIEYDAARARAAAANIERAGLTDVVQVVAGDAFVEIPRLEGTFDFVFLDAWKQDYRRFFDLVFPRLEPGGLFLAHNVVNKRRDMPDFLPVIQEHRDLVTVIVAPSGEGISISYRRR